ncbi:VWA domain-containing protein [Actinokineospora sp. HUAS TT18]|uniref:VWA domain-containing protein n=1 Tax=Actinokineospora sp. HUAS TT18 TaxID=3447451 RepID=UPI003F526345
MSRREDDPVENPPGFSMVVSQNAYLSTEDDEAHAALVVTATGAAASGSAKVAQVIAIDCSGSMAQPPTKINAARRATRAAIDALTDGSLFAVIEGTDEARQVYPAEGMAEATIRTRAEAREAVQGLRAWGGTEIGKWLTMAHRLLAPHDTAVRHVILLTDGCNNEPPHVLDRVLAVCRSAFSCDARGIGADWDPRELLRISEALHGSADAVRQPAELAADFAAMTRAAMAKLVPELRIVVRTTGSTQLGFLRQTHPAEADLTGEQIAPGAMSFTTGSWAAETREYHLRLAVDSTGHTLDTDIRVARVDLEVRKPGTTEFVRACAPKVVLAHWTDDLTQSSRIDPLIARYTGQTDLRLAVLRGCDAHDNGDLVTAAAEWGKAVALATRLENEKVLTRLLRLVEPVGDPAAGVVRVKDELLAVDLRSVAVGSTMSSLSSIDSSLVSAASDRGAPLPSAPAEPDVTCPNCANTWPATAAFCGACGSPLN